MAQGRSTEDIKPFKPKGKTNYALKIQVNGKRRQYSLQTSDYAIACQRAKRKHDEVVAKERYGEAAPITWAEAIEVFAVKHLPKIRESSAERYGVSIEALSISIAHDLHMHKIGSKILDDFVLTRKNKVTESTILRDLDCLSVMFECLITQEHLTANPVPRFKKNSGLKEGEPRTRYLSREEQDRALRAFVPSDNAKLGERDKWAYMIWGIMTEFAIETGLRLQEQLGLTIDEINFSQQMITLPGKRTKNKRPRKVPLSDRAVELINLAWVAGKPHVFTTKFGRPYTCVSNFWEKRMIMAGLDDVEWHDLRRTCACRLLQDDGASMAEVCGWMGHSSVTVTEKHYAFLNIDAVGDRVREKRRG